MKQGSRQAPLLVGLETMVEKKVRNAVIVVHVSNKNIKGFERTLKDHHLLSQPIRLNHMTRFFEALRTMPAEREVVLAVLAYNLWPSQELSIKEQTERTRHLDGIYPYFFSFETKGVKWEDEEQVEQDNSQEILAFLMKIAQSRL
jgi:hypothetical protein